MSGTPTTPAAENLLLDGARSGNPTPLMPLARLCDRPPCPRPFNSHEELPNRDLHQEFDETSPTKSSSDHETPDPSRQMMSTPLSAALATPNIPVDSSGDGEDSMTGSTNSEAALAQGLRPRGRLTNDPETQQLRRTLFE